MGLKFGNLAHRRGIIEYSISPHQQKAFAGAFSKGIPNFIRRVREKIFIVGVPMVLGYLVYEWGEKGNQRLKRKPFVLK